MKNGVVTNCVEGYYGVVMVMTFSQGYASHACEG